MTTTAPLCRTRPWGLIGAVLLAFLLPLLLVGLDVAMTALTSGLQETVGRTLRPTMQAVWLRPAK